MDNAKTTPVNPNAFIQLLGQAFAASQQPAAPTGPLDITNIQVCKATKNGERWVVGFAPELNANVRLSQDAVDALEKSDLVKPDADAKVVSDNLQTLHLRGVKVIGEVGPVRVTNDKGVIRRDATMTKFIEVRSTAVKVTKWAF